MKPNRKDAVKLDDRLTKLRMKSIQIILADNLSAYILAFN